MKDYCICCGELLDTEDPTLCESCLEQEAAWYDREEIKE